MKALGSLLVTVFFVVATLYLVFRLLRWLTA